MNQEETSRTRLLLGDAALTRLAQARVALFGVGGVGGHCAEALVRAGHYAMCVKSDETSKIRMATSMAVHAAR